MAELVYIYSSFPMKHIISIFIITASAFPLKAQTVFKTVVPRQPVVVGESFLVQYVNEEAEKFSNFFPPDFKAFHLIAGPDTYTGSMVIKNQVKKVKNTVYTLSAFRPGRFIIPGAVVSMNGKSIRSNDVFIDVISKEEAIEKDKNGKISGNPDYFLRPGEDASQKISKNLFLKIMVNRRTCFVGEPVLAIFKLYSRLESKSAIEKNPGFYGFTVYDMVNLADKQVATEKMNGKLFDVHTIRKVLLYPLRAGIFTIDAMEVKNKVEFSRSVINKKTEQEIVEGVLGSNDNEVKDENTVIVENNISTDPVMINVKPVPLKNKPSAFNGATGNFTIISKITRQQLSKNEEGILEVTITGEGNFTQLDAPAVQWPAGMEGFDPVIKDSLNKLQSPLTGRRIFRYPFVVANAGIYTIPPVSFSFFNPDRGLYKTITTPDLQITISIEEKTTPPVSKEIKIIETVADKKYWLAGGAVLLICLTGIIWFFSRRKKSTSQNSIKPGTAIIALSIKEILLPVYLSLQSDDKIFYNSLHQATWKFMDHYFKLSGSEIKKDILFLKLREKKVDDKLILVIREILKQCEEGMFTNAGFMVDKNNLLQKAKQVLEEINKSLL